MTQVCQICSHSKRLELDRSIVQGGNLSKIAKKFDVPYQSLYRHTQEHVSRQLAQAWAKKELMASMDILTDAELDLFEHLAVKVQTQNKNLLFALDPPKTVWP